MLPYNKCVKFHIKIPTNLILPLDMPPATTLTDWPSAAGENVRQRIRSVHSMRAISRPLTVYSTRQLPAPTSHRQSHMLQIQRPITGNGNVAIKTGNIYTSRTMTDMIEIPTAKLGFATTAGSKEVSPENCNNKTDKKMII